MLPTNFEALAKQEPELGPIILRLGDWVRHHPDWNVLNPRILAKDMRDVDPLELALTLQELVTSGFFQRVYMIVDPSGVLAEGEYPDLSAIPPRAKNGFNESFDVDDGDIVPVFKPIAE